MRYENCIIESSAHHLPENRFSSEAIENELSEVYERLKLPFGRLELMTGITERRYWPKGTRPSDISTQAALKVFNQSKFEPKDIDLLIHSSVCRDFLEPATASVVHKNLGLRKDCMMFDLSNACLGFLNSIILASEMIERGTIKTALIVSGENSGPLLLDTLSAIKNDSSLTRKSFKKYLANLTIGSAGCAWIISHKDLAQGDILLGGALMTDSSSNHLCQGGGDTHGLMMETDSPKLLEEGIKLASATWDKTLATLEMNNTEFDTFIPHQVGRAHEELLASTLNLEPTKLFSTFKYLGNTGSAACPSTFTIYKDNHETKNKTLALLGIGSGLSSIMLGVKCI